jgi:hypothetical protein
VQTYFRLEWLMPLEPGLLTRVALLAHPHAHDEAPLAAGSGADESEALLDMWTTLMDRRAVEAAGYVSQAYTRRTGNSPERPR